MIDKRLLDPGESTLLRVAADRSRLAELGSALSRANLAVRFLRGGKMRRRQSVMDELSAALQFPLYFGENWDAVDECLADLAWLQGEGYAVIVVDAHEVLFEEPPDEFGAFLDLLEHVGSEWSVPVQGGQAWDRSAKAFHVVLHSEPNVAKALDDRLRNTHHAIPTLDL